MQNCVSDLKNRRRGGRGGRQRRRRHIKSVAGLTNDLISEILARVPYKSLCRFKCVSRSWLALCSSPSMIRRSLSGFFFGRHSAAHFRFVSTLGRRFPLMEGPLFSFLPAECVNIDIVDSCNGLLLFDRHRSMYNMHGSSRYFVCNPVTGNWINLADIEPMGSFMPPVIGLGFDPAESSHFRVFLVVHKIPKRPEKVAGVQIYSSETRGWAYRRQSGWADVIVQYPIRTAFFNGTLHLVTTSGPSPSIVTVDKDGKTWRTIPTPRHFGFIGLSRGRFYAVGGTKHNNGRGLSIWALEDYDGHEWILKQTTEPFAPSESYVVHAIHPEDTLFFLIKTVVGTAMQNSLVSYDFMNNKEHTIKTLEQSFKEETLGYPYRPQPYPYIPCFSKWPLSDGH